RLGLIGCAIRCAQFAIASALSYIPRGQCRGAGGSVRSLRLGPSSLTAALLVWHGGLRLQHGLIIWLVLLAWSPLLPSTEADAQLTGLVVDGDVTIMAQSNGVTTVRAGAMPSAAEEPTLAPESEK